MSRVLTETIVYDFLPPAELNIAKCRMIYEQVLRANLQTHGYPAQDPRCHDNYIRVHAGYVTKTLGIARKTQIRMNDRSQLAEDSSNAEASSTTTYSQITMPPSDASNEMGSVIPSDTIIPHLQQPAMQQLPSLGYPPNFFPANQADMVSGAVDSTSDTAGIFGQQIYQQNPVGTLPDTPFPYVQNQRYDSGVNYYLTNPPYHDEDPENWDMQLSREHPQ